MIVHASLVENLHQIVNVLVHVSLIHPFFLDKYEVG